MATCLAITNQKGGVGKSTTAINLGAALALEDRRVLVVDIDPQGNTTSGLGLCKPELTLCVYDVLRGEARIDEVALPTKMEGLSVVPATLSLAGAEVELISAVSRETRLRKALEPVRRDYDFILIDCPPSLSVLTMNALTAADGVLVPIQAEFYALEGISQLLSVVELVRNHLNPDLELSGVLLTMHDGRLNLCEQVAEEVRQHFGERVYNAVIPRNVKLAEAPSYGQTVFEYDPRSRGAQAYLDLAMEVCNGQTSSRSRSVGAAVG